MAGFWGSVAGVLYVYYNLFLSPHAISLQQSAEILLMAILGGASTLTGPIVGAAIITLVKNVVSTYVERWNTLLGVIFVVVIVFMPYGLVPGCTQLWRRWRTPEAEGQPHRTERAMTPALEVDASQQALRRPARDQGRLARGHAGRAPPDHRPERRRQDHAVQPDHRRSHRRRRLGPAVRARAPGHADAASACISASRAPTRSSPCFRANDSIHNVVLSLLGLDRRRWNPWSVLTGKRDLYEQAARRRSSASGSATAPSASWSKRPTASGAGSSSPWRWRRSRRYCCSTSRSPGSRRTSARPCARCSTRSRATSPS